MFTARRRLLAVVTVLAAVSAAAGPAAAGPATAGPATAGPAGGDAGATAALPDPSDFSTDIDNPYFPLRPGTTNVYTGEKDGKSAYETHFVTVVRVDGQTLLGTPKSAAGVRDVRIPPHLLPVLAAHVLAHAGPGRDGLLFPARTGGYLNPSALSRVFYPAREAAGRPDLRFHDLRHTGAVLAAQTGATLVELMNRLGHSTAGAAMRYQHASADRDLLIAQRLSALVGGGTQ